MDAEAFRDIFRELGLVQLRRMFGGQGVYQGGLMFALEAYGELYLKADGETIPLFREAGSRPFVYEGRDGKTATMSYWLMPDAGFDDAEAAAGFARLALESARRAKAGAAVRRRKARAPTSPS